MLLLKHSKFFKGSSILESIIAIVIISVCVLVAFTIYINVVKRDKPITYYKAKQKVEFLTQEVLETKDYEANSYKYENYSIIKTVEIRENEKIAVLEWTIKTINKVYNVKKIIPYRYE